MRVYTVYLIEVFETYISLFQLKWGLVTKARIVYFFLSKKLLIKCKRCMVRLNTIAVFCLSYFKDKFAPFHNFIDFFTLK